MIRARRGRISARRVRRMFGSTAIPLTPDQRNSFTAALLGWMMDAFDYFIVVFGYADAPSAR